MLRENAADGKNRYMRVLLLDIPACVRHRAHFKCANLEGRALKQSPASGFHAPILCHPAGNHDGGSSAY